MSRVHVSRIGSHVKKVTPSCFSLVEYFATLRRQNQMHCYVTSIAGGTFTTPRILAERSMFLFIYILSRAAHNSSLGRECEEPYERRLAQTDLASCCKCGRCIRYASSLCPATAKHGEGLIAQRRLHSHIARLSHGLQKRLERPVFFDIAPRLRVSQTVVGSFT